MNTRQKITLGATASAAAGIGTTYVALYTRAMHPKSPKPLQHKRRIACVGDSLTYGYGLMGAFRKYSFPAILQKLLGSEYQVMNFGFCDRTLRDGADRPYRREKLYTASLSSDPEIVVLMLGTNDAKPHNWNAGEYEEDLRSYITVYQGLASAPKVLLMQPPKAFSIFGKTLDDIQDEVIKTEIHEIIGRVGAETGCAVIDLYSLTEKHREWFADGLHLNREGANAIAEDLYRNILVLNGRKSR